MCDCLDKSFRCLALTAATIFGLAGVGVAVGAGFLLYGSGVDFSQMELLGATSLKLMLGGGLVMLVFSIVGCAGLTTRKKVFLIPSMFILLLIMIVHAVATVGVLNRRALMSGIRKAGVTHEAHIVTEAVSKNGKTFLASLKHDYMVLASYCKETKDADVKLSDSVDGKPFMVYSAYQCSTAQFIGDMASPSKSPDTTESGEIKKCVAKDASEHDDLKTLAMYCTARHEFADYVNAVEGKQGAILAAALVLDFLVLIGMCCAAWRKPEVEKKKKNDAQIRDPSHVAV